MICRRHGSLPVQAVRNFRGTLSVSSPEMLSSRSTMTVLLVCRVERMSLRMGERLAEQALQAKLIAKAAERRTTNIFRADQGGEEAADDALAASRRTDLEHRFVQIGAS